MYMYIVNSNAHMMKVKINGEPFAHKFCTFDIFLEINITRCQVISPVVNHVLVRGFVIQQVILIFIKCFSAKQLFYTM